MSYSQLFDDNTLFASQEFETFEEFYTHEEPGFSNLNVPLPTPPPTPLPLQSNEIQSPTQQEYEVELPTPVIQNITATCYFGGPINLSKLASKIPSKYTPERFEAVILKNASPKSTALIFKTGKVVVVGTKCQEDAEEAGRKFLQKIKQAGFDASLCDFAIQNIVATSKFGRPLNLAKISDWWNRNAYYEPQIFPGLTFRTSTGTVNMFGTGKVVITGTKNMDDMRKTWSTANRAVYFVSTIVSPKDFL